MPNNPEQTPEQATGDQGSDVDTGKESQAARYRRQRDTLARERDAAMRASDQQAMEIRELRGAVSQLTELFKSQQNPPTPRSLEDYPEHELYKSAMDPELLGENPSMALKAYDTYHGKQLRTFKDQAVREAEERINARNLQERKAQEIGQNLVQIYGADAVTEGTELYDRSIREAQKYMNRYHGGKSLAEHPEVFEATVHRVARSISYKSPEDIEKERQLQARKRLDSPVESPEVGDGAGEGPSALEKAKKAGSTKDYFRALSKEMGF